jgi:hypothetical protein
MGTRARIGLGFLCVAIGSTACATSAQWDEWYKHSSHFASGDHLMFSFRHQGANPTPRVTQGDLDAAKLQQWWGDAIVVRPDQLFKG